MKKTWVTIAALLFGAEQPTVSFETSQGSVSLLEEHMDSIESTLKTQGEAISTHAKSIEDAQTALKTAQDAEASAKEAEKTATTSVEKLTADLKTANDKLATQETELTTLRARVARLPKNDNNPLITGDEGGAGLKNKSPFKQFVTN